MIEAIDPIELVLVLIPLASIISFAVYRTKTNKGMGIKATRALAFTVLVPIIAMLLLRDKLDDGTAGTLLGAVVGFIFSPVSNAEAKKASE